MSNLLTAEGYAACLASLGRDLDLGAYYAEVDVPSGADADALLAILGTIPKYKRLVCRKYECAGRWWVSVAKGERL